MESIQEKIFDRFIVYNTTWIMVYLATIAIFFFALFIKKSLKQNVIQSNEMNFKDIKHQIFWAVGYVLLVGILSSFLFFLALIGKTQIYLDIAQHGLGYFVLSLAIYLFGFEIYFYFIHRLLHKPLLYKHIHYVHHSVKTPTVFTVFCFHPLEILLFFLYHLVLVIFLPLHPTALFVAGVVIHQGNIVGHLGYEFFSKSFRKKYEFISTATFHDQHHQKITCNYGYFFTSLDKVFKTNE